MTNLEANSTGLEEILAMVRALPEDAELVEQATPSISVSTGGLITASATQEAGKVEAGTKSATKQLDVQAAQTITPGTSDKTIASGRYLTGTQTIKGDANLLAENIKSGVSIFDVLGTLEAGGGEGGGGNIATGSIILSDDTSSKQIVQHNLGVIPNLFIVYSNDADASITGRRYLKGCMLYCYDVTDPTTYLSMVRGKASSSATAWSGNSPSDSHGGFLITGNSSGSYGIVYLCTDQRFYIEPHYGTSTLYWQAGKTYNWLVAKI